MGGGPSGLANNVDYQNPMNLAEQNVCAQSMNSDVFSSHFSMPSNNFVVNNFVANNKIVSPKNIDVGNSNFNMTQTEQRIKLMENEDL